MITENYVNFEIARLLKEKGFDLHDTKELYVAYKNGYCVINNPRTKHYPTDEFPKATHQIVMKWLREVYKECIIIYPTVTDDDGSAGCLWQYSILKLLKTQYKSTYAYELYEQACEAAIKYCLKHLI